MASANSYIAVTNGFGGVEPLRDRWMKGRIDENLISVFRP